MTLRDRAAPRSRAGLQAWIASSLFHALLLALFMPLFQPMPRITPEPFRWTISLVEPFDPLAEGLSARTTGEAHPVAALTSGSQPAGSPTVTGSHERASGPPIMAAVQEQTSLREKKPAPEFLHVPALSPAEDSMAEKRLIVSGTLTDPLPQLPQPATTSLPDRDSIRPASALPQYSAPLAEVARNPESPAVLAEPVRPQENVREPPTPQTGELTPYQPPRSSDQPVRTAPSASITPSDAEAPTAPPPPTADAMPVAVAPVFPVTRNDGESSPMVAARLPAVLNGSSIDAGEPGPIRKDETSSAQSRPPADYGWLQLALSRRLEELKRSSRPSIEESGRLRVLVRAVVSNSGNLMEAEVVKSSGHHRIDQEALTLVGRAFPMSLDHGLDRPSIVMRIPITFSRD